MTEASLPFNRKNPRQLSLREKKHLQWQKEREEQQEWFPFGRPGGGAPSRLHTRTNSVADLSDDLTRRPRSFSVSPDTSSDFATASTSAATSTLHLKNASSSNIHSALPSVSPSSHLVTSCPSPITIYQHHQQLPMVTSSAASVLPPATQFVFPLPTPDQYSIAYHTHNLPVPMPVYMTQHGVQSQPSLNFVNGYAEHWANQLPSWHQQHYRMTSPQYFEHHLTPQSFIPDGAISPVSYSTPPVVPNHLPQSFSNPDAQKLTPWNSVNQPDSTDNYLNLHANDNTTFGRRNLITEIKNSNAGSQLSMQSELDMQLAIKRRRDKLELERELIEETLARRDFQNLELREKQEADQELNKWRRQAERADAKEKAIMEAIERAKLEADLEKRARLRQHVQSRGEDVHSDNKNSSAQQVTSLRNGMLPQQLENSNLNEFLPYSSSSKNSPPSVVDAQQHDIECVSSANAAELSNQAVPSKSTSLLEDNSTTKAQRRLSEPTEKPYYSAKALSNGNQDSLVDDVMKSPDDRPIRPQKIDPVAIWESQTRFNSAKSRKVPETTNETDDVQKTKLDKHAPTRRSMRQLSRNQNGATLSRPQSLETMPYASSSCNNLRNSSKSKQRQKILDREDLLKPSDAKDTSDGSLDSGIRSDQSNSSKEASICNGSEIKLQPDKFEKEFDRQMLVGSIDRPISRSNSLNRKEQTKDANSKLKKQPSLPDSNPLSDSFGRLNPLTQPVTTRRNRKSALGTMSSSNSTPMLATHPVVSVSTNGDINGGGRHRLKTSNNEAKGAAFVHSQRQSVSPLPTETDSGMSERQRRILDQLQQLRMELKRKQQAVEKTFLCSPRL